ncbi:MAG: carboxylesterase/lipase family protein [Dehalococcoidia bacterium]
MAHTRREFVLQSAATLAVAGILPARLWAQSHVEVDTAFGRVRGVDAHGIKTFKAIPYGASTAGRHRFKPPADPVKWTGVRDAFDYGPSAPQREPGRPENTSDLAVAGAGLRAESEDCLVLNVWTPAVNGAGRRPVMVWCHGGGFATGSGSSPITDGEALARRGDVVVVTLNHRLNVLGFTFLDEIGGAEFAGSGDAGMLDIVHALKWVRDHIERFGGDPGNVTVFGQSGGGRKVATLLAMPPARGLFHRAVIESGATLTLVERDQAARVAAELTKALGLTRANLRDIQSLPVDRIMRAYFATMRAMNVDQMTMGFSPTMDGVHVAAHPFHPAASTVSPTVPLLLGSTRTELTSSAAPELFSLDEAGLKSRLAQLLGAHADPVLTTYRTTNPRATPSELYFLIASDHRYSGPVMKIAERRAALGQGPVFLYYFRWESPHEGGRFRSPHTIEIPFVFDNVTRAALTRNAPTAQALADKVSAAWLAFARSGTPSIGALPAWTPFTARDRATMVFDDESRIVNDPIGQERRAIWSALGYT